MTRRAEVADEPARFSRWRSDPSEDLGPLDAVAPLLRRPADRDGPGERRDRPRHVPAPPGRPGDGPVDPPRAVRDDPARPGDRPAPGPAVRPLRRGPRRVRDGRSAFDVVYLVIGRGTAALAGRRPGDRVVVWGPLGNGFGPPPERPGRLRGRRDRPDAVPGPGALVARPGVLRRGPLRLGRDDGPVRDLGHPALRRPDRRAGRRGRRLPNAPGSPSSWRPTTARPGTTGS